MKRGAQKYRVNLTDDLKRKLLYWAEQYEDVVWMDSNDHNDKHGSFKAILAVDAFTSIKTDYYQAFKKLDEYQSTTSDWLFGFLSYDLKNDIEELRSQNSDGLDFPDLYFFQPKKLFLFFEDYVELNYLNHVSDEADSDWAEIQSFETREIINSPAFPVKISLRTSKDSYFQKVAQMLSHIERGDIYEANFCQEFFATETTIDTVNTFFHLNTISKPPFATYLKGDNHYALSASPERYIKKFGTEVISQPIKGTARRDPDPEKDASLKLALENDPKERSENIMITDLVRNDLSRFASKGSVSVDELCVPYTFQQVHQLISTIRCRVDKTVKPVAILKDTFPMGSMTGAPKISAMKIIEELEDAKRSLYSGAIGYFTPKGDFDFNVVIRSILYNSEKKYVSFSVGGAITAESLPENEYEECLVKAKAMREVLEH